MTAELPYRIYELNAEDVNYLKDIFKDHYEKMVQVGPKKYCFSYRYRSIASDLHNFQARPDDVWIFGMCRSGTTLTCEMTWLIGTNLDYEGASKTVIDQRFPNLDFSLFKNVNQLKNQAEEVGADPSVKNIIDNFENISIKHLAEMKGKRFLKCHVPLSLMSPSILSCGCKVIYCARDPRDVAVSVYHMYKLYAPKAVETVSFKQFWGVYKRGLLDYLPQFEQIKEAWELRNNKNFLFLFYEETSKDKRRAIMKIADFLGKKLTKDQIDKLEDHLSFEKFRKNSSVNNDHYVKIKATSTGEDCQFIRKGKVGGWRDYFTGDMEREATEWVEENTRGTGIRFPSQQ